VTDPANPGQPYGGYQNPYGAQGGTPYGSQGGTPSSPQGGSSPYGPQGGSNPYGPQGGSNPYAPQGGEVPAPPPYGAPTAPPPKRRSALGGGLLRILGSVLVIALIAGGFYLYRSIAHKDDTINAKVGDCIKSDALTSTTAKEVKNTKIVKCDDASADYKVVGVVDGKTEIQFDADDKICSAYPTTESALWQGVSGRTGSVLCLAPNKK